MTIPLPQLDTRTYDDLVTEAQTLITHYCPTWTDHNPTDPGIVLIELFAWLVEMLLYRIDQIPERHYLSFLQLLNGPPQTRKEWEQLLPSYAKLLSERKEALSAVPQPIDPSTLQAAIHETITRLRERYRAVTPEDYEFLILEQWPNTEKAKDLDVTVKRVLCLPNRNLAVHVDDKPTPVPGHTSVVVVPEEGTPPKPSDALRLALWRFLDDRRLLTTRHHVVGPSYVEVKISARLYLKNDAMPADVRKRAVQDVADFFSPLPNSLQPGGWPFGRAVYRADVFKVLGNVPGVDFVRDVLLNDEMTRNSITLLPHQLVQVEVSEQNFSTMRKVGDNQWK